jgi:hypothetical protein
MRAHLTPLLLALTVGVAPAIPAQAKLSATSRPVAPTAEPDLAAVRKATEKFRDVNVAIAAGYLRDPGNICETADMMGQPATIGAMGIHFFRPDLLGITGPPNPRIDGNGTHTDFLTPSVLIYEPQKDGSLELVAVENLVFIKAWEAAGNKKPPTFQGQAWDRMVDDPATKADEAHNFAPHYDRHVWLYRENPRGMYAQFNPKVSCANHAQPAHKH